jgi:hypothetical protein
VIPVRAHLVASEPPQTLGAVKKAIGGGSKDHIADLRAGFEHDRSDLLGGRWLGRG